MGRNPGRILRHVLVIALLGSSLSCGSIRKNPAPERSFPIEDLLIGLEDMPERWLISSGPEKARVEYNVDEGLEVTFETDSPSSINVAAHTILRYHDLDLAAWVYEEYVSPSEFGKSSVPEGWTYQSAAADPYHVYCYEHMVYEQWSCTWSGLYAEYIVIFHTWLIPDRMTQQDFEVIVQVIDQRMACSLDGSCLAQHE